MSTIKMEMNTHTVTVTTSYSEADGVFMAVTDETCGPIVTGITEKEVAREMKKALRAYGAVMSLLNTVNLYEKAKLGKATLKEKVVRYEIAEAA